MLDDDYGDGTYWEWETWTPMSRMLRYGKSNTAFQRDDGRPRRHGANLRASRSARGGAETAR